VNQCINMHKENIHTPTPTLMKETVSCMFVHPFRPCIHMFSRETCPSLSRQPCISSKLQLSYYHMQISEHWLRYVHVFLCFGTAEGYYLCTSPPKPLSTSFALSSVSIVDNGSFSDLVCFVRNFAGTLFGECSSSRRGILPILVWKLASVLNP
jgi:hypothetical protein